MNPENPDEHQFLLYSAPDGAVKVDVFFKDESVWLTQKAMAELYAVERSVVTKHLRNILASSELQEDSVCAKIAHTAADGKTYSTNYYNRVQFEVMGCVPTPQRGKPCQPRATPWVSNHLATQALKGRPKRFRIRAPFQGLCLSLSENPGRCPGLPWNRPLAFQAGATPASTAEG